MIRFTFSTFLLLSGLFALSGCSQPQIRSQKEEETEKERYPVKTVGDVSTFSNADSVTVSGVGLVEGLEGNGSPAPVGELRAQIENELRRMKVKDIKGILNSRDFSIVLVQAVIPAGSRKGDKIDLEVTVPPGFKTTSLRGGYLHRCTLYNYDSASNINPTRAGNNAALRGHPLVRGDGALLVGLNGGDDKEKLRRARVWGGGVCQVDRQFLIMLNSQHQFTSVASNVASRVNAAFQDTVLMTPGNELSVAKTNTTVTLNVPPRYKLNLPRFLRVVRMVPLEERSASKDDKKQRPPYKVQLAEDLLDPARTVSAALRLEALGTPSIPALREGLKHDHPLVRFCSAEALSYLGSPSAGDELARVIEQQPYLRAFALTAMASLDEAVCYVKLKDLLASDQNDETRYGAFRALLTLDEKSNEVRGELLNETYWIHEVAPGSKPLVHLSTSRRAEIVLFGETPKLIPPFTILSGEYALTAQEGATQCTIAHIPLHSTEEKESRVPCPLELNKVVPLLAKMGATYPEVIEVIRQADSCKNLTCRVRIDALPQALQIDEMAKAGKEKVKMDLAQDVQIIKPDPNFGGTPTLFQKANARRTTIQRDAQALQQEKPSTNQKQQAERK